MPSCLAHINISAHIYAAGHFADRFSVTFSEGIANTILILLLLDAISAAVLQVAWIRIAKNLFGSTTRT